MQDVHLYHTRQTKNSVFFLPSVSKALAQNQLVFRGIKFWSELNDSSKHLIMMCLKKQIKKSFFGSLLTTKFSFNHLIYD